MRTAARYKNIIATIATILLVVFSSVSGGAVSARAAVSASPAEKYEAQNVWTDLQGAKIDGKGIDLSLYNFDESKNAQVLSFVEFCYAFNTDKQSDYGLYAYVYNPRGFNWTKNEQLNKIQLNNNKYPLKYLNRSTEAGYEGLFYKFKVDLTEEERATMLGALNSSSRVYEVGEIELYHTGANATAYNVGNTFTYTGYAKGYGSDSATDDTLSCTSSGLMTLTLDVHPTYYRPEGTNGKDNYTQDSLHSVYFSIPNEILDEYGGLSAVHATWLNAVTAPIFVTGNKEIYNAIEMIVWEYLGDIEDFKSNSDEGGIDYCWAANARLGPQENEWVGDYYFGDTPQIWCDWAGPIQGTNLNLLYYLFYADGVSADDYTVSSSELLEYMERYSKNVSYLPEPVAGKYFEYLFDSVDEKYTDIEIKADDKYTLANEKLTQSFWQKLFGTTGTKVESSIPLNDIQAIYQVKAEDIKATADETSKALYISESDYAEFKAYYAAATKKDETVFLFRYQKSEYISREVTEFAYKSSWGKPKQLLQKIDTNAYLAQETVNLDFDIIDVTCTKGDVSTVIACVMSPQDIVHDATPPVYTTPDKSDFWKWVLTVTVILIALFVGVRVVKSIIKKGRENL